MSEEVEAVCWMENADMSDGIGKVLPKCFMYQKFYRQNGFDY